MAIADNLKDLSVEVLCEYLAAAKMCTDTRKPSGGILGYPAAVLLLCAIDAIGHGLLPGNGKFTRLDVLKGPPFNLDISDAQIDNLANWYRHSLVHAATIAPGAFLTPDTEGEPFDFDGNGAPIVVRVPVLYEIVRAAWEKLDASTFDPPAPRADKPLPDPRAQRHNFVSSLTSAASGVRKP